MNTTIYNSATTVSEEPVCLFEICPFLALYQLICVFCVRVATNIMAQEKDTSGVVSHKVSVAAKG